MEVEERRETTQVRVAGNISELLTKREMWAKETVARKNIERITISKEHRQITSVERRGGFNGGVMGVLYLVKVTWETSY